MKILYFCPRFHTNMVPLISELIANQWNPIVCVSKVGKSEDHSNLRPVLLQQSPLSKFLFRLARLFKRKTDSDLLYNSVFFPSRKSLKSIRAEKEDIIIVRNYSLFSLIVSKHFAKLGIKSIVEYDQNELTDPPSISPIKRLLFNKFIPKYRYSPISNYGFDDHYIFRKNGIVSSFIPFVAPKPTEKEEEESRSTLRVFSVGKYIPLKNLEVLLDAIPLTHFDNISITITGECASQSNNDMFQKLEQKCLDLHIEKKVNLIKNTPYKDMSLHYLHSDVFVLCSKQERASISVLEAIAKGSFVISTDKNGTNCYIKEFNCGVLFDPHSPKSLAEALDFAYQLKREDKLRPLVRSGQLAISKKCSFDTYIGNLLYLLNQY